MNYVTEAMALEADDVGKCLYDAPIVKIGSADDTLWEQMKGKEDVGELFRTPKEWLKSAKYGVNCPAKAITLQEGKSHIKCTRYFDTLRERYAPRFGCGKCQVGVPCERKVLNLHK